MYLPDQFTEFDQAEITRLITENPLAVVTTLGTDNALIANDIPLLVDGDNTLIGHVAKANTLHEKVSDGTPALAIFRGEESYISPNWYPTKPETHRHVPTWNYQVVHVHGRITFTHDAKQKRAIVGKLTKYFETLTNGQDAWKMADAPKDYMDGMIDNIVGFAITIDRIEAKSKLSQNRERIDHDAVADKMDELNKLSMARAMKTKNIY